MCTLGGRLFLPLLSKLLFFLTCSSSPTIVESFDCSQLLPLVSSLTAAATLRVFSTRRLLALSSHNLLRRPLSNRSRCQSSGFNFMDTAARNLRGIVEDVQSPSAGLLDFPSPASDLDVYTPDVGSLSLAANVTSNPWPGADACLSSATSAIPDTAKLPSVSSPAHEFEQPGLGFDTLVGARVAPAPTSPPPVTSFKDSRDLRLPSFSQLGIAAPHSEPVRPLLVRNPHPCLGGDDSSALPRVGTVALGENTKLPADPCIDDDLLGHVDASHSNSSPTIRPRAPLHSPMHHYVTTLTPPDDSGRITWEAITQFATGPMNSPMAASGVASGAEVSSAASDPDGSAIPSINVQVSTPMEEQSRPWLKDAITIMRECCPVVFLHGA